MPTWITARQISDYVEANRDEAVRFLQEIIQTQPDGTVWRNVIRMTPEGFCMIEADCEGHDCIEEGEVTLTNMRDRLLWNMVICAPHRLTLSLYSPEEAAALSRQLLGY